MAIENLASIQFLLSLGARLDFPNLKGQTPFDCTLNEPPNIEMIRWLIQLDPTGVRNALAAFYDPNDITILHRILRSLKDQPKLKFLLQFMHTERILHPLFNVRNKKGQTPFLVAAEFPNFKVGQTLFRFRARGIDASLQSSTPLMVAVKKGNWDGVKSLLAMGASHPTHIKFLRKYGPRLEQMKLDRLEQLEIRYRIYFQPSLVSQLLIWL